MPTPSGRPSMMDAILAGEPVNIQIANKDACFSNPVKSMNNGKYYTSRHAYEEHLNSKGLTIVGNDSAYKPKMKEE